MTKNEVSYSDKIAWSILLILSALFFMLGLISILGYLSYMDILGSIASLGFSIWLLALTLYFVREGFVIKSKLVLRLKKINNILYYVGWALLIFGGVGRVLLGYL